MRIEIRRAHPEEADTLTEIAHAAKRHWKYPESWIQQWQTDLTISGEFIRTHEVFAATINGAVVGCCALVVTDSLAEIEHMWIRPEQMGSGVGRALFEYVRARAVERGANVHLNSQPILTPKGFTRAWEQNASVRFQLTWMGSRGCCQG